MNRIEFEYLESKILISFYQKMERDRREILRDIKSNKIHLPESKSNALDLEILAYNEINQFNSGINIDNVQDYLEPRTFCSSLSDRCYKHLKSVKDKIYQAELAYGSNVEYALSLSLKERSLVSLAINNLIYLNQEEDYSESIDPYIIRNKTREVKRILNNYDSITKQKILPDRFDLLKDSEKYFRNIFPLIQASLMENMDENDIYEEVN